MACIFFIPSSSNFSLSFGLRVLYRCSFTSTISGGGLFNLPPTWTTNGCGVDFSLPPCLQFRFVGYLAPWLKVFFSRFYSQLGQLEMHPRSLKKSYRDRCVIALN